MNTCAICGTEDEAIYFVGDRCSDCEGVYQKYRRYYERPEAPQKPVQKKAAPVERICAHKACTNVLVPTGKRGRPSVYCSAECRKVGEAEYDEERMRLKRQAAKAQLAKVISVYGPGMHIVDVYDREPENGWDNGETISGLKVIGSSKPWNEA